MEIYGFTELKQLSKKIGIPNSTINTWDKKAISKVGEVLLKTLIENKKLKDKDQAFKNLIKLYKDEMI